MSIVQDVQREMEDAGKELQRWCVSQAMSSCDAGFRVRCKIVRNLVRGESPGKNEKRFLAGALNASSGRLTWVEGTRKTSALFIALVDHLVTKAYSRTKVIHLVLDNFRIHSSRAVEAARARWGDRVQFHFLPPYCPDNNRIERLWKDLHGNVTRNHKCTEMSELMANVNEYLEPRRRTGI